MAEPRVPETADEVWTVLVEECGANPDGLAAFSALWPCDEYRFIGTLGFGGKVRWKPNRSPGSPDGWAKVDFYREDSTPEREHMRDRANARLLGVLGASWKWRHRADVGGDGDG